MSIEYFLADLKAVKCIKLPSPSSLPSPWGRGRNFVAFFGDRLTSDSIQRGVFEVRAILEINFRIGGDFWLVLFPLAWLKKSVAVARATAQC